MIGVTPELLPLILKDLDLEHITGAGALHIDRARERVASPEVETKHVVVSAFLRKLSVGPISGLERQHLAWGDGENRLDLRVPAIVPRVWFTGERLA